MYTTQSHTTPPTTSKGTFLSQLFNAIKSVNSSAGVPGDVSATPISTLNAQTLNMFKSTGKTTTQLAQMIYDSQYIQSTIDNESTRVQDLDDKSRRNIYKVQQMTLMAAYTTEYFKFLINIIVFSVFITVLCLAVGAAYKADVLTSFWLVAIIILSIAVVYTLGMIYAFHSMRKRNRHDWNQLYFRPSKEVLESI